ncbi:MAG: hypothetical protein JWM10_3465 [Myxococcaceae bacterium]|nr:hypothetical protein [Myxococcaceae bacterium]
MYIRWKRRPLSDEVYREDVCCAHQGKGRETWTPVVVGNWRVAGLGPRQIVLWRPAGSIRSCCAVDPRDPIARSRWWAEVNSRFKALLEGTVRNPHRKELLKEHRDIYVALVNAILPPSADEEALLESWYKVQGYSDPFDANFCGRHRHYFRLMAARRIAEESPFQKGEPRRTREVPRRPRKSSIPAPLRAIGVGWPCTRMDIIRAYRTGAFEKHPDRGGTNEGFVAWGKAVEAALEFFDAQSEASVS